MKARIGGMDTYLERMLGPLDRAVFYENRWRFKVVASTWPTFWGMSSLFGSALGAFISCGSGTLRWIWSCPLLER
jgi:hypothetical protein